jgi:Secretion system C-terminal sorting domain
MKPFLILTVLATFPLFAQHSLPFASTDNTIELAVTNSSSVFASNVSVAITDQPQYLKFTELKTQFPNLKPNGTAIATFTFSVDKYATVNQPAQITFTISNSTGEQWTKQISIQVSPPDHFELFQNYPNPFNPTTVISYQLPADSHIELKIYNSIGQELKTLTDDEESAGYHQETWDASEVASGMYIYQLTTINEQGKKEFYRKKMLVVK